MNVFQIVLMVHGALCVAVSVSVSMPLDVTKCLGSASVNLVILDLIVKKVGQMFIKS